MSRHALSSQCASIIQAAGQGSIWNAGLEGTDAAAQGCGRGARARQHVRDFSWCRCQAGKWDWACRAFLACSIKARTSAKAASPVAAIRRAKNWSAKEAALSGSSCPRTTTRTAQMSSQRACIDDPAFDPSSWSTRSRCTSSPCIGDRRGPCSGRASLRANKRQPAACMLHAPYLQYATSQEQADIEACKE